MFKFKDRKPARNQPIMVGIHHAWGERDVARYTGVWDGRHFVFGQRQYPVFGDDFWRPAKEAK